MILYDFVGFGMVKLAKYLQQAFNKKRTMVTTRLYLDTRFLKEDGTAPLKISITKKGRAAYISTGISLLPSVWDKKSQTVIGKGNNQVRNYVNKEKSRIDDLIMQLVSDGQLAGLSSLQIRDKLKAKLDPDTNENGFIQYYKEFSDKRRANSTKRIYNQTYTIIKEFDSKASRLRFEDINKNWLDSFEQYLRVKRKNTTNTIAIHMRNIRAVFNDAIDNDITDYYPFRKKYKIKKEETRKRSLSIEQLRELFNYEVEPFLQKYLDTFKLVFFLIGINIIDLCNLDKIENGRINYKRAKTGRLYSIKIEPEAQILLNKYKGKHHLFGLAEGKRDYFSFLTLLDKNLKRIGDVEYVPNPNKDKYRTAKAFLKVRTTAFEGLSIYWARHTWASVAAYLDIPKETISAALGHGIGNPTTSIYIDFDREKIDDANRKVIDYVLYNKK